MRRIFITLTLIVLAVSCSPVTSNVKNNEFKPCPSHLPADMACIPGGKFILGSDAKDWKTENWDLSSFAVHNVVLSTFLMDKYEVTNRKYKDCIESGKCSYQRSNYEHMREDNQPQLKVTWFQARDYCRAYGKRLPTEAEFEAASRGNEGSVYPWGNTPATCELAVIKDESGRGCYGHPGEGFHSTPDRRKLTGNTWDVGSKPAGYYGLFDMSGNAQEWVSDWFAPTLLKCGAGCQGNNPKGPCNGSDKCPGFDEKIVKGGSWYWGPIAARSSSRRPHYPANKPTHHFGFRCAKSVE